MMLNVNVNISKRVKNLKRLTENGLIRGLQKASLLVEKEAKSTRSFTDRTGVLRNSIAAERPNREGKYVDVKAKAGYAKFIEDGTRNIKARNYMKDAAKKKQKEITQIIEREITKELNK